MKKVGIIMGSDSDLPIIRKATGMLDTLEVPYEVHVYSAHRTPVEAKEFSVIAQTTITTKLLPIRRILTHLAALQ